MAAASSQFSGIKFVTYIEFDLELHLYENHTWSNSKIGYAINEGIKAGATLQLDKTFGSDNELIEKVSPIDPKVSLHIQKMRSWSQFIEKNTFTPIISVDKFFENRYQSLPRHSLEQSPCFPTSIKS